ncbi:hypothetical protein TTHERM_00497400 (macronuclear) [Tetrahymena thermophila SB210]|uniref:Uncharacterized protein n=1 Tax=Tetrahymena thermophila (strain SB210) TaxID=312017 RepID=I7MJZ6_TETTS|nr:hypothetical protein TTHERM_00497400 [Tetrahymena thermophila SB210]EAS07687.2 hypothetical protein TTHERM_00497400 [Tetrahymena thermophila SB210]|eukprot:XP_001027929.2 hypothetical protein TTHERM_00497400 [Tetrahymena thermophila SB210]
MIEFQSKQFLNETLKGQDLYNYSSNIQHLNLNNQQQEKQKEKHALNQLRLLSEYVEYNESFGAWGEESLVAVQEHQKKNEKLKNEKGILSQKQKMMFKNTLNEMSQALCNLENGSKKNNQLIIPKQKLKSNLQVKEKAKVVQYEFDSVDIISDLKKLRDDLQESPDRLTKVRGNNANEIIYPQKCQTSQEQKYLKQKSQLSFNDESVISMNMNAQINECAISQDQNPTQRSRSISTTANQRIRKDQQLIKQNCDTQLKTQESSLLQNGQYSNLLGSCGNSKLQNIQNIRYPTNGCNVNASVPQSYNQEKGILHYIIKMKSKDINNIKVKDNLSISKNYTVCQNTVGLSTAISETAPATPQAQTQILGKQNQNFVIQKKLGRQLFDFENKQCKIQSIQNNPNQLNANELNQSLNLLEQVNQCRESKIQNQNQNVFEEKQNQFSKSQSSSQKKIQLNDTLRNYKQILSARKDLQNQHQGQILQQELVKNDLQSLCQQNKEEMYNFESSSKFLLKKSVSSSFQQNEEISKDNNSISINMSNSKRMSCQEININRQSNLLLIQDEGQGKQCLATQPIEENENENINQFKRKSLTQQVRQDVIQHHKQKSKENISKQDLLKIQFFEKVKNKIMQTTTTAVPTSSSHRVSNSLNLNKNQNICQQLVNLTNSQTPLNSQSVTPTNNHNKANLSYNQNISFSRAIAGNSLPFQKKEIQTQRGSINLKQNSNNLEGECTVGNNLCIKSTSLPKKFSKQEQENQPISYQDKKTIKNQQNFNEIKTKVPIVQMLTNRISRESNLLMSNILKEKNINISSQNLNQKDAQQNPNVYKSISLSFNPFNNNYFENTNQDKNITPKNIQIQSNQYQAQSLQENRLSSLLPQQQQQMNPLKGNKIIKQIPKIPKPVSLKIKNNETDYEIYQ